VTLELQALLLFAHERGIDVVKWFTPDDASEAVLAKTSSDLLLTKEQFSGKLTGLGLGLGAGQDEDTQTEIANGISKGSVDTCCRRKNCDADSPHLSGAARMSLKTLLDVSKVPHELGKVAKVTEGESPQRTAIAARKAASSGSGNPTTTTTTTTTTTPPRQPRPPPVHVDVPPIKPAPPLPLAQKPLWSPSAVAHQKMKQSVLVPLSTPR